MQSRSYATKLCLGSLSAYRRRLRSSHSMTPNIVSQNHMTYIWRNARIIKYAMVGRAAAPGCKLWRRERVRIFWWSGAERCVSHSSLRFHLCTSQPAGPGLRRCALLCFGPGGFSPTLFFSFSCSLPLCRAGFKGGPRTAAAATHRRSGRSKRRRWPPPRGSVSKGAEESLRLRAAASPSPAIKYYYSNLIQLFVF